MNKGIKKLLAYLIGIVTAGFLKVFPWGSQTPILDDNNFMTILITSNVLFVGANIVEHSVDAPKDDDGLLRADGQLSGIERKLIAFLSTFGLLLGLILLGKIGQDAFTYCFVANIGLFITGNIIGNHIIDGNVKNKLNSLFSNLPKTSISEDINGIEPVDGSGNAKAIE